MNNQLPLAVCAFGVLLVSACGSSSDQKPAAPADSATASASAAADATGPEHVMTAQNALGTILTDDRGRALYLFVADTSTTSTCAGDCAKEWPPLTTKGAPVAGPGVNPALVSTSARPDGTTQLTYNGHPLYYYDDDKGPGTTKGQGETSHGANWYVLTPAGDKIDKD
jgi:predicted lipoprotein with Yx(FWY)xxD motif